ncbi:hypothetical protein JL2886_01573 [Phaeobacter gallaeciensis]|uniref:Uncharacterized protein n=1 Tax=Phaeobacter gallaeciensis TaxID=60890 RepID=A0A1B0ZQN1_9RHOB|nr:hypothetical protein JL2886_01573 [Phaeobacter gallaeciensis]
MDHAVPPFLSVPHVRRCRRPRFKMTYWGPTNQAGPQRKS